MYKDSISLQTYIYHISGVRVKRQAFLMKGYLQKPLYMDVKELSKRFDLRHIPKKRSIGVDRAIIL